MLLAHDAVAAEGVGDAAVLVDEREADVDLLLLLDAHGPYRPGRADLRAEIAVVLAVAEPRDEDRCPEPLEPRLGERRMKSVREAHLHAFAAPHAAAEEFLLGERARRPDERWIGARALHDGAHRGYDEERPDAARQQPPASEVDIAAARAPRRGPDGDRTRRTDLVAVVTDEAFPARPFPRRERRRIPLARDDALSA